VARQQGAGGASCPAARRRIADVAGAAPAALLAGSPAEACLLGVTLWPVAGGALLGLLRSAARPAPRALHASPAKSTNSHLHALPIVGISHCSGCPQESGVCTAAPLPTSQHTVEHGLRQQSNLLSRTCCPGCRRWRGLLRLGTGKHAAGLGWPCPHHAVRAVGESPAPAKTHRLVLQQGYSSTRAQLALICYGAGNAPFKQCGLRDTAAYLPLAYG